MIRIRGEKDFGIGLIYLVLGLIGLVVAQSYSFGTTGRMGPGYFPTVISSLLVIFGLVALVKGFLRDGAPLGKINWKGLLLVTLSVAAFGALLERAGLAGALIVLILVSAAASARFRFEYRAAVGVVALMVFCIAVFVEGLGLPMPVIGAWFK